MDQGTIAPSIAALLSTRLTWRGKPILWAPLVTALCLGSRVPAQTAAADNYKLSGSLTTGVVSDVASGFHVSSNNHWTVYLADQDSDDVFELYSVPIDGSQSPIKLNGNLVEGGDVWGLCISPDSTRVVYVADQDTDEVDELYAAPVDVSQTPVKLNQPFANPRGNVCNSDFETSPDSTHVVYRADQDTDGAVELFASTLGQVNTAESRVTEK